MWFWVFKFQKMSELHNFSQLFRKRHDVVRKHLNRGNRHRHRQIIPTHYYGPPSAGWGGFQPGQTGTGWGAPYWYK